MVPPDFEATTNSVFLPAISAVDGGDRRRVGVVEDVQRGPDARLGMRQTTLSTSGHSELPPIPSSTTSV